MTIQLFLSFLFLSKFFFAFGFLLGDLLFTLLSLTFELFLTSLAFRFGFLLLKAFLFRKLTLLFLTF